MLADGDGEADIHLTTGGDESVGVEAAVGPHRELPAGPGTANPAHRFTQEVAASGFEAVGYTLSQSGQSAAAVVLWSALIAETVRLVVVLAGFLKKDLDRKLNERSAKRLRKRLDKARKEGRVEGRVEAERAKDEEERAKHEEERTASTEWLKRRDEAQRKGDPFDEEPPWEANGASES